MKNRILLLFVISFVVIVAYKTQAADLLVSSQYSNQVLRYDGATGAFLGVFASGGGLKGPRDLAFGPDKNLYVGDAWGARNVLRYNGTTGAFMDSFTSGHNNSECDGIAFGPDGNLYVSSTWGENQIIRYNGRTGAFIDQFVTPSSGGLSHPTYLLFTPEPASIILLGIGGLMLRKRR